MNKTLRASRLMVLLALAVIVAGCGSSDGHSAPTNAASVPADGGAADAAAAANAAVVATRTVEESLYLFAQTANDDFQKTGNASVLLGASLELTRRLESHGNFAGESDCDEMLGHLQNVQVPDLIAWAKAGDPQPGSLVDSIDPLVVGYGSDETRSYLATQTWPRAQNEARILTADAKHAYEACG